MEGWNNQCQTPTENRPLRLCFFFRKFFQQKIFIEKELFCNCVLWSVVILLVLLTFSTGKGRGKAEEHQKHNRALMIITQGQQLFSTTVSEGIREVPGPAFFRHGVCIIVRIARAKVTAQSQD